MPGPGLRTADHERLVLEARDVAFDWAKLPFHYVPGEPFTTHMLNVLHLLLPAGEEFFVDLFKQALPLIKDDQLRLDVQGFIGQEAMHSQAHTGVQEYFAANDIDVTPFTDQMNWLFGKLLGDRPRWSVRRQHSWLLERVALVSAIEHYTAILGEWILDTPQHDAIGTDPVMLDMLRWHGAEEVEHKAVAFDLMKHLRAGYLRQVRTQLVVTPMMLLMWVRGVRFMYSVDPQVPQRRQAALVVLLPGCPTGFDARAAALRAGDRRLLPAGFPPVAAGRGGEGGRLPGDLTRRARIALSERIR